MADRWRSTATITPPASPALLGYSFYFTSSAAIFTTTPVVTSSSVMDAMLSTLQLFSHADVKDRLPSSRCREHGSLRGNVSFKLDECISEVRPSEPNAVFLLVMSHWSEIRSVLRCLVLNFLFITYSFVFCECLYANVDPSDSFHDSLWFTRSTFYYLYYKCAMLWGTPNGPGLNLVLVLTWSWSWLGLCLGGLDHNTASKFN